MINHFKRYILFFLSVAGGVTQSSFGQEMTTGKFEQLERLLPTPNDNRTASGMPGQAYWQQKVDYKIDVSIDEKTQLLSGFETITYHNNSPHDLAYLWVQIDQNSMAEGNIYEQTKMTDLNKTMTTLQLIATLGEFDYDGGVKIEEIKDADGQNLRYVLNKTMMRIDLPKALKAGETYSFSIKWNFVVYDCMQLQGRGGYEYFPKDDNYIYSIAQWFPRLCVYDDVEGWQNKQHIRDAEFALEFGSYEVNITMPADHIVAATGELTNAEEVLSELQYSRLKKAHQSFDVPIVVATEEEAVLMEQVKSQEAKTWTFKADNVRDFAFASSRKFIWDVQAVKLPTNTVLAMSYYPKEANSLWGEEATQAIKNTLEVYSERLFDYPYPVAIAVNVADQGMEYPMISFNGTRANTNGSYNQKHKSDLVNVIVHEIGHNYFPMIINSDEKSYAWMDEGINTFFELETKRARYPDLDTIWGSAKSIINYMRYNQYILSPTMTDPENINFSGYNQYAKPSVALDILRQIIIGPELFDFAFKTYANQWKFKRPKPADFFRIMEDASAVDLDWFWRGWFYGVEPVDIAIKEVKWFRIKNKENKKSADPDENENTLSLQNEPYLFSLSKTDDWSYGEYTNRLDDTKIIKQYANDNFYEVKFENLGGLLSPVIVKFTFDDNSSETIIIPAEIWRYGFPEASKVFHFKSKVKQIQLDPNEQTADIDTKNNVFPRK